MKKTMRRALAVLFLLMSLIQLQAQTQKPVALNVDMHHGVLTINGSNFIAKSTRADYERSLGSRPRVVKLADKDKFLFYDDMGLSFALKTGTDSIQIIRVNYNSLDSFRFAKGQYKGTLSLNGISISTKTNPEEIEKIIGVQLVTMPGASSYLGQTDGLIIILKYASSGISEIGFQFNYAK